MNLLITFVLLTTASSAFSGQSAGDTGLSVADIKRISSILEEGLRDGDITQKQYDQSIFWIRQSPCNGVDRTLSPDRKKHLEAAIAKEKGRESVKVFESYASDGWLVLFTNASDGDAPYLFYPSDPMLGTHAIYQWSGAATIFETGELVDEIKAVVPEIPSRVANCFAWSVTLSP